MSWQDSEQIRRSLEVTFNDILQTRMHDVPVLNPALSVRAVGFLPYQQEWLGVLVTPWFMNLLLLPEQDSTWQTQEPGSKFSQCMKCLYGRAILQVLEQQAAVRQYQKVKTVWLDI